MIFQILLHILLIYWIIHRIHYSYIIMVEINIYYQRRINSTIYTVISMNVLYAIIRLTEMNLKQFYIAVIVIIHHALKLIGGMKLKCREERIIINIDVQLILHHINNINNGIIYIVMEINNID